MEALSQRRWCVVTTSIVLLGLAGCREKGPKRTYAVREGRVRSVNPETGEVSMTYVDPKTNAKIIIQGRVTQNTEILVNGRSASLDDVRIDEWVKVTGYREGPKSDPRVVATRVEIQRTGWGKDATGGGQPGSAPTKPKPAPSRGADGG